MQARVDARGRITIPKPLLDALGITSGSLVDVSRYGLGLLLIADARTGRLAERRGQLVVIGNTTIDDDDVRALIDAGRW